MKRYFLVLLSGLVALQPISVLASTPNSSDVLLITTPQAFSVIVPTELPVHMNEFGIITTAEDAAITNTSKGPIIVHDISVEIKDSDWSRAHYTADFGKLKVNSKVIGLQFNGDNVTSSGTTELNPAHWPAINGLESMTLDYKAKLAAQSNALNGIKPVKVVFTLKWYEVGKANIVATDSDPIIIGNNKLLTFNFTNIIAEDNSVTWSSSDETVATVKDYASRSRAMFNGSKSCEVTAVSAGTATITGTLKDGTSASMDVIISEKVEDVAIGTRHIDGNYEYSYGEGINVDGIFEPVSGQEGWGVKIIDNSQTDYISPLTMIQGYPVTNMSCLFYIHPTTTINLIDWDTSSVTNMSKMFYGSPANNLDLSSFNTVNVTDMSGMFYGNMATSLDVSSFNTSSVTNMSSMFWGTMAISLDLSGFDTSNVTDMSTMFTSSKTTSLDLSSFNTSKVTNMIAMFVYSKATSLDGLRNFDTSNVTNMQSMFESSLVTNLDLSNFDVSNVIDMQSMFQSSKATYLDLSSFDVSNVTDTAYMFAGSQVKNLIARTQIDADKYQASRSFPTGVTVTVKF